MLDLNTGLPVSRGTTTNEARSAAAVQSDEDFQNKDTVTVIRAILDDCPLDGASYCREGLYTWSCDCPGLGAHPLL